jgi:protein FAM32A
MSKLIELHSTLPRPHNPRSYHTMPSSDYTAASGGALRIKGGGIDKKKKKKKSKPDSSTTTTLTTANPATDPANPQSNVDRDSSGTPARATSPTEAEEAVRKAGGRQKTEAEKRHEEMRRKRLDEKIKREGIKTHKEKVEELNKYLSGLSEHHDMPKIGPG